MLFLRNFKLAATHSLLLSTLGAGIGLGSLATCRQMSAVPKTSVGTNFLQALDVISCLPPQITLSNILAYLLTNFLLLIGTKLLHFRIKIYLQPNQHLFTRASTYSINVGQSDFNSFSFGEVYTGNTSHKNKKTNNVLILVFVYVS